MEGGDFMDYGENLCPFFSPDNGLEKVKTSCVHYGTCEGSGRDCEYSFGGNESYDIDPGLIYFYWGRAQELLHAIGIFTQGNNTYLNVVSLEYHKKAQDVLYKYYSGNIAWMRNAVKDKEQSMYKAFNDLNATANQIGLPVTSEEFLKYLIDHKKFRRNVRRHVKLLKGGSEIFPFHEIPERRFRGK